MYPVKAPILVMKVKRDICDCFLIIISNIKPKEGKRLLRFFPGGNLVHGILVVYTYIIHGHCHLIQGESVVFVRYYRGESNM